MRTISAILDRNTAVGADLGLETRDLASGKLVHATIENVSDAAWPRQESHKPVVCVVHVVVNGIDAGARAGIASGGALVRGRGLGGSVRDGVPSARAASLEGVVESNPMSGFVGKRLQVLRSRFVLNGTNKVNIPCQGCSSGCCHRVRRKTA